MTDLILLLISSIGACIACIGCYTFLLTFKTFGLEFDRVIEVDTNNSIVVKTKHLYVISIFFICSGVFILIGVST